MGGVRLRVDRKGEGKRGRRGNTPHDLDLGEYGGGRVEEYANDHR